MCTAAALLLGGERLFANLVLITLDVFSVFSCVLLSRELDSTLANSCCDSCPPLLAVDRTHNLKTKPGTTTIFARLSLALFLPPRPARSRPWCLTSFPEAPETKVPSDQKRRRCCRCKLLFVFFRVLYRQSASSSPQAADAPSFSAAWRGGHPVPGDSAVGGGRLRLHGPGGGPEGRVDALALAWRARGGRARPSAVRAWKMVALRPPKDVLSCSCPDRQPTGPTRDRELSVKTCLFSFAQSTRFKLKPPTLYASFLLRTLPHPAWILSAPPSIPSLQRPAVCHGARSVARDVPASPV